jgi:hypothetical protein
MYTRKTMGIIALIIGLMGFFSLNHKINSGNYEYLDYVNVINIIIFIWIILSFGSKIAMIFEKRRRALPIFSCIVFTILLIISPISIKEAMSFENYSSCNFLVLLWTSTWAFIDFFEAIEI